jgi:hypothetical protein
MYDDLNYQMDRLSVEESAHFATTLAHDPRYKTSQENPQVTEQIRTGTKDQIRASVERAMAGMQRAEQRLRQEGIYRSDGRIITEEEARQLGMRIARGEAALPHADPHGFTRDPRWAAAQRYGGDPRCAPGAYLAEQRGHPGGLAQQGMAPQMPTGMGAWGTQGAPDPQQVPPGMVPLQETQQPRAATLACGNMPMVGDIIQRGGDVLAEVQGASQTGVQVEIPQMGRFEIPFGHLHEYTLLKRRGL